MMKLDHKLPTTCIASLNAKTWNSSLKKSWICDLSCRRINGVGVSGAEVVAQKKKTVKVSGADLFWWRI